MKNKYFILAIMFFSLLAAQSSFGQKANGDVPDEPNCDEFTDPDEYCQCKGIICLPEVPIGPCVEGSSAYDPCVCNPSNCNSGNPCDISSNAYDECICSPLSCDSGDVCDMSSSAYNFCACLPAFCTDPPTDPEDPEDPPTNPEDPPSNPSCPVGFTKENVMSNDLSSCKEDFVITGIKVSDSKDRTANTNETLFILDDDRKVTITALLDRNVWTPHHHIITQFAVNNITDTHLTAVSGTKTATGGWPNSSTHNVEVSILPKINYIPVSSLSFPGVTSTLDAIARNANKIGEKTSFNLNISRSVGENEVDPGSRFIRTFTKYSGSFGFSTSSGDVAVPGWSFQTPPGVPKVEAGLFLSISGGASCSVSLKKYQLNNGQSQNVYSNDSSVSVSGNATVKATVKALAEAEVFLVGTCTFEIGCSVSAGAELIATANDGSVNASLTVGKLEGQVYYHINTTEGQWEDSVSRTLLDGFKIIDNKEIFKY